jgi:hypothetical protein
MYHIHSDLEPCIAAAGTADSAEIGGTGTRQGPPAALLPMVTTAP